MKRIQYKVLGYTQIFNPETQKVERKTCFAEYVREYSKENEEIAKQEAYRGEYTVVEEGEA